jgi:hypothetical protein
MQKKVINVEFNALSELKSVQDSYNAKQVKASNLLNSANKAMNEARKDAVSGVQKAKVAQKLSKELGVNEGQFDGWLKQFENELSNIENVMQIIGNAITKI